MPGEEVAIVAIPHRSLGRVDEMSRRLEAEGNRVADIEVTHPGPARFQTFCASATMFRMA